DITKRPNPRFVIDLFGLSESEARKEFPSLMQYVMDYVRPERLQNRDRTFLEKWWLFGRPRPELRSANRGLKRYIVTSEVAKHRVFVLVDWPETLIDGSVIGVASADAYVLGVMSSRSHVLWALEAGGRLEDRPRYQNGPCFDPFPFPDASNAHREHIRSLGESLDAHRKRQQVAHPELTITDMYNVLEKLRSGEALTAKQKIVHEQGLVSVLKQIHDDLDAAVAEAYGWPVDLRDEEILQRLVALNAERAEEERRGLVRWLRPEFQNPGGASATQGRLGLPEAQTLAKAKPGKKTPWPKTMAEQARVVRATLQARGQPVTSEDLAKSFSGKKADKIAELLETLTALGQARAASPGRY
ncbi:MAG: type IIL restriction-modification enzyme MmeI, partial [Candidatus Saccharimonadales bacterium]